MAKRGDGETALQRAKTNDSPVIDSQWVKSACSKAWDLLGQWRLRSGLEVDSLAGGAEDCGFEIQQDYK